MIDWFTPQFRMTSLEALKAYATEHENVLGTLLVGSGARGFTDQYSDIDVVFVAEDEPSVLGVVDDLASWLPNEFKLIFMTTYRHEPDIFVICLITENGLELDVAVWSLPKLRATKPDWKLIQSRSPVQDQLITAAMQQPKPSSKRIGGTEIYGDDPLWQSVNRLAVARLRRNLHAIANVEAVLLDKSGGTDNETIMNSARKVYVNPRQLQFIESLGIGL